MQSVGRPAVACGPLVADRFTRPSPARTTLWRRRLNTGGRPTVLLSTGAWGAATRIGRAARLLDNADYLPVVLCGRDERLRREQSAFPVATVLGWVDDMPGLMGAADVLVDNAAGQTALQALAAGLPVVGYQPIPGHGAEGVRRMADLGLSSYARGPGQLLGSLGALCTPGPHRGRRIAAGRALFAADTNGPARLESLAGHEAITDRRSIVGVPVAGPGGHEGQPSAAQDFPFPWRPLPPEPRQRGGLNAIDMPDRGPAGHADGKPPQG